MATAGVIASRGLKRILVEAADSPLEPDEYQDFLDAMNSFMADLEARNIVLGYTEVSNVSDEVTVPPGAVRGIVANVAIEVAPDYGGKVSEALVLQAKEGMNTLRKLGQNLIASSYPTTLPRGSGSRLDSLRDNPYYGCQSVAVLSLAGNARETEITAASTAVRVTGFWSVDRQEAIRGDINGVVRNIRSKMLEATVELTLQATGNGTYQFIIAVNGEAVLTGSSVALTSTATEVKLEKALELDPSDYVEILVLNTADTENCTVTEAQLEVYC